MQYAEIHENGTIDSWSSTTSLTSKIAGQTTVVRNGYLYVLGGLDGVSYLFLNIVQYSQIHADGSIGLWNSTTSLLSDRYFHTSIIYSDYLYVLGGFATSNNNNEVHFAPFLE